MLIFDLVRRLKQQAKQRTRRSDRPKTVLGGANDWRLEDRRMLAGLLMPSNTVGSPEEVLHYYGPNLATQIPASFTKYITITNHWDQTIYPFLEGKNDKIANTAGNPLAVPPVPATHPEYASTGNYNPYDPVNHEYRAYIGYTETVGGVTTTYAGLQPYSQITVPVPIAFWDSGRINISTDGVNQFKTGVDGNNAGNSPGAPFFYHDFNTQALYQCYIDAAHLDRLYFLPVFDSFDAAAPHAPTAANWVMPSELRNGLKVTGKGLPSDNPFTITLVPGQNYVQLSGSASGPQPVQQYTFQSPLDAPLSPTARYTSTGFELIVSNGSTTTNGAVMWYHALKAENPGNDAAFQLTEVTFRSDWYDKTKAPTNFELFMGPGGGGYLENNFDIADYDVSYVDTAYLPVAMEARAVPIQSSSPVVAPPFGWVGSPSTVETFQTAYQSFVNNTNNILGSYFGTHGYPQYNAFNPDNFVKLPAGQNIFLQSPFSTSAPGSWKTTDGSLTYNLNQLNSGGNLPAQLPGIPDNSSVAGTKNLFLQTNTDERKQILKEIQTALSQGKTYSFSYNTTGTDILVGNVTAMLSDAASPPNLIGVVLDQNLTADALNQVYTPRLKPTDFAGVPIAQLFFTWANHYATHVVSNPPASPVAGTVSGSTIVLNNPETGLVPGMKVTGPGGANYGVILTVNPDNKTLLLSQNPGAGPFSFAKPNVEAIVGYSSLKDLFPGSTPLLQQFEFASSEQAYALEFAQTVYTAMSAWSVTVDLADANPPWVQLMVNVVGGNFYAPMALGGAAGARLTVLQKSALRGIPDFTNPLYSDPSLWYPDPSVRQTTGQAFNVFNLMPYVWLMHAKLGVIAYTFSLDDDVGNVNAKGATHVDISVGGLQTTLPGNKVIGLLNTDQFTPPANYGVVSTGLAGGVPAPGSSLLGGGTKGTPANLVLDPNFAYQVLAFDQNSGAAGATVNSAGIPVGTSVETQIIGTPRTQDGLLLTNPMGVTSAPYHFFGTQVYVGSVLGAQAPNTIILDPDEGAQYAYLSLLKMGPLTNIRVQGPGIPPDSIVTIQNVTKGGDGKVTLTLSSALHSSLVKPGSYAYSFGGPLFPTIRNPGFEFGLATDVTDRFLVGQQAAGAKAEWEFTPGSNGPTNTWESGVQYGNGAGSKFTNGNPVAPQGLQVGFIQGDSKIAQKINLAPGHYQIGFMAAQSAAFPGQTLQVTIADSGGNVLHTENITPVGTTYTAHTTQPFTASRSGLYTVTLKGTVLSTATVLFDQIATEEVEQGVLLQGDFNADGLTDIATRLVNGDWQVSLTQTAGNATLVSLGASTNNNWTTNATWLDWTVLRSGDRDVIVARAEVANVSETWWKLSYDGPVGGTGAANFHTNFVGAWTFSATADWIDVVSGDFDGNAKLDIIARDSVNGHWWMLQNAAETTTPGNAAAKNVFLGAWSSEVQWDRTLAGNFTGNSSGRAQVAGLTGSTWWLSEYEGTPGQMTHTVMTTKWSRSQTYTDYVVGNFDGNSSGALLIAGKTANNAWYSIGYSSSVTPENNLPSLMGVWPGQTSTYTDVVVGDFFGSGGGMVGIAGVQRSGGSLNWQVLQRATAGGSYTVRNFGTWPQSTLAQAFAGLFSSSDISSGKTGILGRRVSGGINSWDRGISNGSAFTVVPVTGYPT
jgi:hypothetical protein